MAKVKTSPKQKKSLKNITKTNRKKTMNKNINSRADLIPYDPVAKILDKDFIGRAILECLSNNDPEGVMEVIQIYLDTLEKTQFVENSSVPKSTLYHSLKSKNPTIKTLAKLVHATTLDARK